MFVAQLIYNFAWILKNENWDRWIERFKKNTVPCLMIYDKSDPLFKKDTYVKFSKLFKSSKLFEINGAGHIAINEQPEVLAQEMIDFLNEFSPIKKAV